MKYIVNMKKIHNKSPKKRIALGVPFEEAIEKFLLPKTNNGNLSDEWNVTDWVRYSVAQQISRHNNGKIPKSCMDMLKKFVSDVEL